jgi:DNA-binding MarR family transcriptional regulator
LRRGFLSRGLACERQEGAKPRVYPAVGGSFGSLGPDTRARLGTQGDHRDPEENLVADQVIHDYRFAVVGDDVRLVCGYVVLFAGIMVARSRCGDPGDEEGAQRFVHDYPGRPEAACAGDDELGRYRPSNHDVRAAFRHANLELTVALGRLDVGPLDDPANPRRTHFEAELLAGCVEVGGGDEELVGGHRTHEDDACEADPQGRQEWATGRSRVDDGAAASIISHTKHLTEVPLAIPSEIKPEVDAILEAIVYLSTESRRITKELARRADLTGPQLTVLKVLEGLGDLSLSDLSERIRAQNSTVTGIIDRMEREGLVVRTRSTEDRRVIRIRLTEKGARIAREIAVEPMEIFRSALENLSPVEMRDLLKILTKIARRVQSIVKRDVGAAAKE